MSDPVAVTANAAGSSPLRFWIDPGTAPPEVIANVLTAISNLHRAAGGSGLTFAVEGADDAPKVDTPPPEL